MSARRAGKYREASHAGLWYTDNPDELSQQLEGWLKAVDTPKSTDARAVIAPHAGYSYSGPNAAYSFAQMDPERISRVFVIGPSHWYSSHRCMLSRFSGYKTPIGDVPIDLEVYEELRATGEFDEMSERVDEADHALEMHIPYIVHIFKGRKVTIVPMLVGSLEPEAEESYAHILHKYLKDPTNFFSISSDFCHWGVRFNYTYYEKDKGPIYKSIEALDRRAMDLMEAGDPDAVTEYFRKYENTICGRHAINILLHMMKNAKLKLGLKFVKYDQSSQSKTMRDSSVSYAAAVTYPTVV